MGFKGWRGWATTARWLVKVRKGEEERGFNGGSIEKGGV